MSPTPRPTQGPAVAAAGRPTAPTPPPELGRQLALYAFGVLAVYIVGLVAFWPGEGNQPNQAIFLLVMFAPTVGALMARMFAGGRIQWGRPGWWLVAGLLPALAGLGVYALASALGWVAEDLSVLSAALVGAPIAIGSACISALGEEIGWRGFLWPTLRERWTFLRTSAAVFLVWWLYHVPFIVLGWYGSTSGLPAFTVAIAGFTLFVGVLTDRSRSLWPSTVAHGAWNGLVATSFAATEGGDRVPAFSGSAALLGEFGWLAALTMAALGVCATVWHLRSGSASTQ